VYALSPHLPLRLLRWQPLPIPTPLSAGCALLRWHQMTFLNNPKGPTPDQPPLRNLNYNTQIGRWHGLDLTLLRVRVNPKSFTWRYSGGACQCVTWTFTNSIRILPAYLRQSYASVHWFPQHQWWTPEYELHCLHNFSRTQEDGHNFLLIPFRNLQKKAD